MHMADALLSPAVGIAFWTVSGAALAHSARRIKTTLDDHKVPLMGVLGAFIFAAQMINFTIPGTGSSGHLGGGLLLALLLGPAPAFLTIASVLVIQAFFFADGGLLALGANIFNLGVFPCVIGLPLFRLISGANPSPVRLTAASITAAAAGLELGAMSVVFQTLLSGRSELAVVPFAALMGGIHLPIGTVEGFVTAAVLGYVLKIRPELTTQALGTTSGATAGPRGLGPVLASFAVAALLASCLFVWFGSTRPDGLEWSIARVTGGRGLERPQRGLPGPFAKIRRSTSIPDSTLPEPGPAGPAGAGKEERPGLDGGRSAAGFVGAILTLAVAGAVGFALTRRRKRTGAPA